MNGALRFLIHPFLGLLLTHSFIRKICSFVHLYFFFVLFFVFGARSLPFCTSIFLFGSFYRSDMYPAENFTDARFGTVRLIFGWPKAKNNQLQLTQPRWILSQLYFRWSTDWKWFTFPLTTCAVSANPCDSRHRVRIGALLIVQCTKKNNVVFNAQCAPRYTHHPADRSATPFG